MNIQDLFERDIHRSINGVVKADQLDDDSVWQELDEFVVTRELTGHINELVAVLLSTIEQEEDASGKNGVWISGFFGCGKSHFIKVLSYLLENKQHRHNGESRRAVEFFATKLTDPMLFADLKKVVAATTDTILFNIDSKADLRSGRDTLLQVFLKVLNEKQGYSGDHPHIANTALKAFARDVYPDSKSDLFAMFIERNLNMASASALVAMITRQSWMFLSSLEQLRTKILDHDTILSMAHLGAHGFDSIGGEVVSTTAFVLENAHKLEYKVAYIRLVDGMSEAEKAKMFKEAIC